MRGPHFVQLFALLLTTLASAQVTIEREKEVKEAPWWLFWTVVVFAFFCLIGIGLGCAFSGHEPEHDMKEASGGAKKETEMKENGADEADVDVKDVGVEVKVGCLGGLE